MLYVFSALTDKIRSLGGVGLFDTLWGVVMEELKTNTAFESIAKENFPQAWNSYIDKVGSFDLSNDDAIDKLTSFMTESPRNIQQPVWTRWGTVSKLTLY